MASGAYERGSGKPFCCATIVPGYRLAQEDWPFLFNSYYETEGARIRAGGRARDAVAPDARPGARMALG